MEFALSVLAKAYYLESVVTIYETQELVNYHYRSCAMIDAGVAEDDYSIGSICEGISVLKLKGN